MSGAIHPLPHFAFMAWFLVKHRDNFTSTFIMEGASRIFILADTCSVGAVLN
jgi:hypothetical protein